MWVVVKLDIYIKPAKKAVVTERTKVFIEDFTEIVATKDVSDKVKKLEVLDISKNIDENVDKGSFLISVSEIVKAIKKVYPDYTVNNLGEMDTLIEYKAQKSKDNSTLKWLKVAFVSIVLLVGSASAIMSFHTDAQMGKVFEKFYSIIFNKESSRPLIIEIPYSIGLASGIIVFFNHFIGKKITDDPTPIEVEMTTYEGNVIDTMIDTLNTEQVHKKEGQKNGHD